MVLINVKNLIERSFHKRMKEIPSDYLARYVWKMDEMAALLKRSLDGKQLHFHWCIFLAETGPFAIFKGSRRRSILCLSCR